MKTITVIVRTPTIHWKQLQLSSGHLQSTENNYSYRPDTYNPLKTIKVNIRTSNTYDRAPRFIKKSVKIREKYKY